MFLTLAILMVLLSQLLPIGLTMMALAVAVLLALALTGHRPKPASPQVDATIERESAASIAAEPPARAALDAGPAARTEVDGAPSTSDRELVGARR